MASRLVVFHFTVFLFFLYTFSIHGLKGKQKKIEGARMREKERMIQSSLRRNNETRRESKTDVIRREKKRERKK